MASVNEQAVSDTGSRLALRSSLGVITLVLLCAVQFLDIADAAIVNVALPSIQRSLGFSQQNLQWVSSGYILTYGGFLLLGGRLGDLLGRRRVLLTGLAVFAVSSLTAGLATSAVFLVAARLVQGIGAALMAPAALSAVTTSFREGKDRNTALGIWGAISGMAAAAGVFLGGVLSQGPGWAAGLLNSSQQIGSALGLAILSAVAITSTTHLIAAHASHLAAADAGYHQALLVGSILMAAAAVLALRIGNTRKAAPVVMVNTEVTTPSRAAQGLGPGDRPPQQRLYPDK